MSECSAYRSNRWGWCSGTLPAEPEPTGSETEEVAAAMAADEPFTTDAPLTESPEPLVATDPSRLLGSLRDRAERGSAQRDEEIESLKHRLKELQGERKTLDNISGTLEAIHKCVEDGRWSGALNDLRGAKKLREQLLEFDATSPSSVDEIDRWLEVKARDTVAALPRTLIAELGDEVPDPESRAPRFVFRRSFVTVEINRKKFEATVATRTGKTEKVPADAPTIAERVREEISRCFNRATDLSDFSRRLRTAYDQTEAGRRGEPAGIRDVAAALGDEVALDEFSVDLARLLASPEGSLSDAQGLKLDHTKDTDRGLLLPGLEERGYFGSISYSPRRPQPKDDHADS